MRNPSALALCVVSLATLLLAACGKHEAAAPVTPAKSSSHVIASTSVPATPNTPVAAANAQRVPTAGASLIPVPSASTAAVPNEVLHVDKLTLGDAVDAEHKVTQPASRFDSNDKTIYACVTTSGNSGGATLNAKWSYLEGNTQLISSITQSIATEGPAVTTFKVYNPDLWPEGKYRVEISLDGKPVAKQDYEIGKS